MSSSMGNMKVVQYQFARGLWEVEPSLSLAGCKRFHPLSPNMTTGDSITISPFDLKSFIRPDCGPRKLDQKRELTQVESHPGGTRWNPTQEQIGILEMLYRSGGMRTPNAQQIEQITTQLGKYGKIEGKNVFYWFQNHKARERQKQKRNSLGGRLSHCSRVPNTTICSSTITMETRGSEEEREESPNKRKCRNWTFKCLEEDKKCCIDDGDKTLELFPLHPEGS